MSEKKYKSLTGIAYTFPVFPNGNKPKYISLAGPQLDFFTSDKNMQKAIERSKHFKSRKIGLAEGYMPFTEEELTGKSFIPEVSGEELSGGGNGLDSISTGSGILGSTGEDSKAKTSDATGDNSNEGSDINADIKVYEDITDWQAAKDILRSDPYNIAFQSLNTPANILKHAELNKVSFPKLKQE